MGMMLLYLVPNIVVFALTAATLMAELVAFLIENSRGIIGWPRKVLEPYGKR